MAFGAAAMVSGVLAYPVAGHAFWISHSYADCAAQADNSVNSTGAYHYFSGKNLSTGKELGLTCGIDETSDRLKNTWKTVNVKVRDYNSVSAVRVMACLESESGSGGGCGASSSSTGSTGAIEALSLSGTQLSLWVGASGCATLHVFLPVQESGKSPSGLIGYYPSN
jgi:hypothetical protein